ncbi:nucleotidyl transferase AbiEii/AbiGii toxin family protein [Campylobacter helveticus]|uniref:nucleotidyl transferase AbiEii/AbiGii toxin family protein n=1 Tax=Campylobacter helveticus TaxID=28898 RepID=UPI0022EACC40|nr:nucleotidyl transferase AbiEii/AbiGii toxin family protein [Campylobacter helveticus]
MQEREEKYELLYKTQDKIIDLVVRENLGFYLTGGTALQRFHYNQFRFSDDLDFFLIDNGIAKSNPKEFTEFEKLLRHNKIDFRINVTSSYFMQIFLYENNLKIDLVNDYVFHESGDYVKLENGLLIDSIQNIFVNKLETLISRDEPRDLFDIYTILTHNKMDMEKSFKILNKKCNVTPEEIISNLKNIRIEEINYEKINVKSKQILEDFSQNFNQVIDDFFNVSKNKINQRKRR